MKKMTSRERLMAAARRQPYDMIPISPRVGYAALHHYGTKSEQSLLRLKSLYDYDPFITVPGHDLPFKQPFQTFDYAPGVEIKMKVVDEGDCRIVDKTIITPDGDMHEIKVSPNPDHPEYGFSPDPVNREFMVKSREDLPKLRHLIPPINMNHAHEYLGWESTAGEEAVVRSYFYSPFDYQAGEVMNIEDIMINSILDRELFGELIDIFWQYLMSQMKAMLDAGVRYFFMPWFWHSLSSGWSPQQYREWFFPLVKEQVDLIHSYNGIASYYDDGQCMELLPMMLELGVDVFETCCPPPIGDFDLAEARKIVGDKITLMGYVDLIYVLQRGTVEDVKRAVKEACMLGGAEGNFILGTSDQMREGTPVENIEAYFKYGREYGKMK